MPELLGGNGNFMEGLEGRNLNNPGFLGTPQSSFYLEGKEFILSPKPQY